MKRTSSKIKRSGKTEDIGEQIEAFLRRNPLATFKKRQLAKVLGYTSEHEYARFKQALRQLEIKGKVRQTGRRKFGSSVRIETVVGRLSFDKKGSITIAPEKSAAGEEIKTEIVVPPDGVGDAGPGDRVAAEIVGSVGKFPVARVTEILEHEERKIVGTLERVGSSYKILVRDRDLPASIDVSKKKLKGAEIGDKVVARLLTDRYSGYSAQIATVLGEAGDPDVEIESISAQFGLRKDFPGNVMEETKSITEAIPRKEISGRLDLRKEIIFTIDPEDARDFDDAVSLKKIRGGLLELGVHIADVSHYVGEGTALDDEAYKRGTSVYLTSGVIPMLPHKLSNEICSLNPGVDRLTYSVIVKIRPTGAVVDYKFAKSVIRSKRRFTYEEVQKIIDTGKGDHAAVITEMHKLAMTLTRIRNRAGSIDFDLPEAKFVLDNLGRPIEIVKKQRLDSHRLVEEFMLLANKTVAMHIGKHGVKAKPFVYRVHDVPDPDRIRELAVFVSHFGYSLNFDGTIGQKQLQRLLKAVEGKTEEYLINDIMLRSMAKAVYSEKNIGHYGLAFKYYTHFTSPIRRYPDLMVHRLLYAYEAGKGLKDQGSMRKKLAGMCKASSDAERRAVEAERESVKVKQVQFMLEHIGDEFEGTISGITSFGMFVEVDELLVEGLVHVREMDDYYTYVPGQFQLKGRRSGKMFQLGDRLKVKVLRVNMERHEIDFAPC